MPVEPATPRVERVDWSARTAVVDGVAFTLDTSGVPEGSWRVLVGGYVYGHIHGADREVTVAYPSEARTCEALQRAWYAPGSVLAGGSIERVDYAAGWVATREGKRHELLRNHTNAVWTTAGPESLWLAPVRGQLTVGPGTAESQRELARDLAGVWGALPEHCLRPGEAPAAPPQEPAPVAAVDAQAAAPRVVAVDRSARLPTLTLADGRVVEAWRNQTADGATTCRFWLRDEPLGMARVDVDGGVEIGCADVRRPLMQALAAAWFAPAQPPAPAALSADRTEATVGEVRYRLRWADPPRLADVHWEIPSHGTRYLGTVRQTGAVLAADLTWASDRGRALTAIQAACFPRAATTPRAEEGAVSDAITAASLEEARRRAKALWIRVHDWSHGEDCPRLGEEDDHHEDCQADGCAGNACWVGVACDCDIAATRAEVAALCADLGVDVATTTDQPTTQEDPMPTPTIKYEENPTIVRVLQADATDAAWRTAGAQFVKACREPLVGLLARHLGPDDESLRAKIAAFVDTRLGDALLSELLSIAVRVLPLPPDVSERLQRELRVRGLAEGGDVLADALLGPARTALAAILRALPAALPATPAALGDGQRMASVTPVRAAEPAASEPSVASQR